MHLVLQQEWINGKNCLMEAGERESLLDILNLSLDVVDDKKEGDIVSGRMEKTYPMEPEEAEEALESLSSDQEEQSGEIEEMSKGEEVKEELEEESLAAEEDGEVITWYYSPNGSLFKGY